MRTSPPSIPARPSADDEGETRPTAAQLVDDFLDASHIASVHSGTFGTDEAALVVNDRVVRNEMTVRTTFATQYRDLMVEPLTTRATENGQVVNTTGSSTRNVDAIRRP